MYYCKFRTRTVFLSVADYGQFYYYFSSCGHNYFDFMLEGQYCDFVEVSLSELCALCDIFNAERPSYISMVLMGLMDTVEWLMLLFVSLVGFCAYVLYT